VGPVLCSLTSALSQSREQTAAAAGHARFGGRSMCDVCFTVFSAANFVRYTSIRKTAAAFTDTGAVRLISKTTARPPDVCTSAYVLYALRRQEYQVLRTTKPRVLYSCTPPRPRARPGRPYTSKYSLPLPRKSKLSWTPQCGAVRCS
jgi:hypothetical protein